MWLQKRILLRPRSRGFHLITDELLGQLPDLGRLDLGMASFFIQHTSASLTINENADPSVRRDLESYLSAAVPEQGMRFTHTLEGPDDMPAHIKASVLGATVTVPVARGRLQLGTWQGIYLGEHRDRAEARSIIATLWGETAQRG